MAWQTAAGSGSIQGPDDHGFSNSEEHVSTMAGPSSERTPLLGAFPDQAQTMSRSTQHLAALVACISAIAIGTTMGWTSAASATLKCQKEPFTLQGDDFSWVSAFLAVGAICGAIPLGTLANTIGRKKVLILLAPFMVVGYLLLAFAQQLWMLFLGRFILGAVTGAYCVVTPMYTGEIAEPAIRGVLGSYFQLLITLGILISYTLNAVKVSLFWINIICAVIPAIMAICIFFFPDSPRWHLSKMSESHDSEAEAALKYFRGTSDVKVELDEIKRNLAEEQRAKLPFTQAFTTKAAKKGLFLALAVMFFQQFSGINAVVFYASQILGAAEEDCDATGKEDGGLSPSVAAVIVGVCQILATYVSTHLIDRLGRKPLLILSGSVMAVSGAVLGLYFYLDDSFKKSYPWLPIACLVIFIIVFSLGYGPIPWLYMGEVYSAQIKEAGMSIATVANWLSVFVVTKFYEPLSNGIGSYSTFWIFSAISALGCFFTFFFVIETKGKEFDEILRELGGTDESLNNSSPNAHDQRRNVDNI